MAIDGRDPYRVLGVPRDASLLEIARARRRLAKRYHPDVAKGEAASEEMLRINAAWDVLSNPTARASWDARGGGDSTTASAAAWTAWAYPPRPPAPPHPPAQQGRGAAGAWTLIAVMVLMVSVLAAGIAVAAARPPGPDPAPWLQENLDR